MKINKLSVAYFHLYLTSSPTVLQWMWALHHQPGNPHTVTQQRQWERYNFSLKIAKTLLIWCESQKYSKLSFSWAAVTPMTLNNRCWRMVFYSKLHSQMPLIFVPSEYPHEVWAVLEEIRMCCQLHLLIHQIALILPGCCSLLQAMCGQSVFLWYFPPHAGSCSSRRRRKARYPPWHLHTAVTNSLQSSGQLFLSWKRPTIPLGYQPNHLWAVPANSA